MTCITFGIDVTILQPIENLANKTKNGYETVGKKEVVSTDRFKQVEVTSNVN